VSTKKLGLFVSKGVHSQFSRQVKNLWGFKHLDQGVKYLGVSLFLSANKSKDFSFVKENLNTHICGWKSKTLSQMGHATLIKSIALASPMYVMSAFKLPKGLCAELDAMVRKFWWNPKKEGSRLYTPMAWLDICKPLIDGGLGFRSFESFNEAMIAKLAWWVLSNRDSFCVRVLRSKYNVGFNWLNEESTRYAYYAWRGLESVKDLLSRDACRMVESRNEILVWETLGSLTYLNLIPNLGRILK
jgi:hypothetical protein